ncbi:MULTISPECIES: putative colanic acid biosynthesis acetyltransferase [unclassified Bradyrhizobium]|uniref:putative colanic acid biosynthesis acetyltransferase n=1 Tax=unclassified Bradyrhizobium TaxID=2631580 RepID=UPI001FF9DAE9|nr:MULTISPECIES: putative colanic acid biosynthesis acetyltransferase [unclassified Bradyrhizobium]MCK1269274.1 putative colanic acid biosynthesis acetyltransferase [Bradyrhizobium sp. 84]MCK1374980.1 putative colanic acid biosynthesis acetyltransferase [Bradyrhizobium sp. 49]MCK1417856.1 putative colanic acid biosynthesis acetyltransferase [Bradyrhizobium sp. CW4]MCK1426341.1 putative colanic acid biosynthesis acetyltransferase [Bradyrhizobium sp. 87]
MLLNASSSKPMEGGPSFSLGNRAFRVLWMLAWASLARWTPAPLHRWRRLVLILFGAKIAKTARVYSSVDVWYPPNLEVEEHSTIGPRVICYSQDRIVIGKRVIISQGSHLCTGSHDINDANFQLITKPIVISDNAWIAAECFVGPGVNVGEGAVLGARGVAFRDLNSWTVYTGNPAQAIKNRRFRNEA